MSGVMNERGGASAVSMPNWPPIASGNSESRARFQMPRLRSIDGKADARKPVTRVSCPKCDDRLGITVRAELVQLRIGADLDANGRVVGGHKVWVCARCWARAEFTPIGR